MSQGRLRLSTCCLCLCLSGAVATASAQEELGINFDRTAPINLEADASEFDRRNDRLSFTELRIRQGELGISADKAVATRLDFDDSVWMFSGNVVIESANTRAWADTAQVRFLNHQLYSARLAGAPARFRQERVAEEKIAQGRAKFMDYELESRLIRMTDDAWVSDGSNEVSGPRIAYDLAREFIIADSDASGQVTVKIIPSEENGS